MERSRTPGRRTRAPEGPSERGELVPGEMGTLRGGGRALTRKYTEFTGQSGESSDFQTGVFPVTKHFYASHCQNFMEATQSKCSQRLKEASSREGEMSSFPGEFKALRNTPTRDLGRAEAKLA